MFGIEKKYPEMNEEEKEQLWDCIADWYAAADDTKEPRFKTQIYEFFCIPERTFYNNTASERFGKQVVRKSLNLAKKQSGKIMRKLAENAINGKEYSIEMFLKYVGDLANRFDITSGGEKVLFTPEQYANIIREEASRLSGGKPEQVD